MIITLISAILLLSIILMFTASSPLSLGGSIFLLTTTLCLTISLFSFSWFSLLLFLVYVGGLLIMFAYFIALSPNQLHLFLTPRLTIQTAFFMLLLFLTLNPPLLATSASALLMNLSISSLFTTQNFLTLNFAALALFITLLAVVKTVALPAGPLRPFSPLRA